MSKFNFSRFNKAVAGASVAAVAAGVGLTAMSTPAFAAGTAPSWEPDPQGLPGTVVFYDAQGNVVTSGTNDLAAPFAYAAATGPLDANANSAVINYSVPTSGELTAQWPAQQQDQSSLPLVAGTDPANLVTLSATHPVAKVGTTGNISIFNTSFPTTSTPGYQNVIAVRVQDSGPRGAGNANSGTWWAADIAFNTTSSPITVLGVSVPADGWAQVFPVVTPTATSLTTNAPSGGVAPGTPIQLNASDNDPTAAGTFNFFDNGTLIGSADAASGAASFTYTPSAAENASFTATFSPTLGDVANPNTANATMVGSSTSAPQAVTVSTPKTPTSVTLAADNNSIANGGTVNLTATASGTTAGSVEFLDGTTSLGTAATNASGVATLATSSLRVGANSLTAVFTPTDTADFASSTSAPVVVTEAAPTVGGTATGNVQVTVSAGTLTVTTGFTASNPLILNSPTLSSDGTYLSSTTPFKDAAGDQLTVTDSLSGDPGWTLSAESDGLSDGAGHTIAGSGLGLTGLKLDASGAGTVTTTDAPAHNPSPIDTDTNTGLASTAANPNGPVIATAAAGNGEGTTVIEGTADLFIPTSTPAGTYNGTIVFTAV